MLNRKTKQTNKQKDTARMWLWFNTCEQEGSRQCKKGNMSCGTRKESGSRGSRAFGVGCMRTQKIESWKSQD